MQLWCVFCSAGWVVAAASLFMLSELTGKEPRWLSGILAVLVVAGMGSCAAEDRVCEIAGLPDGE